MNRELKEILEAFDGKLVGSKAMKAYVCETLAVMPEKFIDIITTNCWFVASFPDAHAFVFKGSDLKDQSLVFLSDELFEESNWQIHYTIAHEIGHVILNHRNSVTVKQSKEEIKDQEAQADEFTRRYV